MKGGGCQLEAASALHFLTSLRLRHTYGLFTPHNGLGVFSVVLTLAEHWNHLGSFKSADAKVIPREVDLIGLGCGLDEGISSILTQVVTALTFEKTAVNCGYLRKHFAK